MPPRKVLRGLAPPVRLAPLQQRVHRGSLRGPLLASRSRHPPLPVSTRRRGRHFNRYVVEMTTALGEAEHALHVEAVGALFVGGDRGVGERAAGDDRRPALDQGRRAVAQRAVGGRVGSGRPQLRRPLGRWEVDAHRDLRGAEGRAQARARLRRRHRHVGIGVALHSQRLDQALDHRRARLRLPPSLGLDDAAEDQPLAGAGGGDVEQPQALLGVARLRLLAEGGVVEEVDRGAAEPAQLHPHPRWLLAAQDQQRRSCPGQQAAREVGHGDDVELQPLGVVDGHDPHPVVALGGGCGLALGVDLGPGGEEVEQAAQVAALAALELGGQPHQLADVGEACLAGRAHQHRQVVAGLGGRRLDQGGEGESRAALAQGADRGHEAAQQLQLGLGDVGQALRRVQLRLPGADRALQRRPDVAPPSRRRPQQPEGVRGGAAGGGGEGAEERLVVERVGDRRQQRADVGDLLLGPVAAATDHVGAQAGALERVLVGVEVGEGAQQHHHLAAGDATLVQLTQARRDVARLGQAVERRAPVDRRLQLDPLLVPPVARGQQQLNRGSMGRRRPHIGRLRPIGRQSRGRADAEGAVASRRAAPRRRG